MTSFLYTVVIYTGPFDVEPGFAFTDQQMADRLYRTVAELSPWPVALYRHEGNAHTFLRFHDRRLAVSA